VTCRQCILTALDAVVLPASAYAANCMPTSIRRLHPTLLLVRLVQNALQISKNGLLEGTHPPPNLGVWSTSLGPFGNSIDILASPCHSEEINPWSLWESFSPSNGPLHTDETLFPQLCSIRSIGPCSPSRLLFWALVSDTPLFLRALVDAITH